MNESEELAFIAEDVKAIAKDVFFYFLLIPEYRINT